MAIILNLRGSDQLQQGYAQAPTDTGLASGDPAAPDALGREHLEERELAVNLNADDPCLWLRRSDGRLAKFRPTADLRIVNTWADLPVIGPLEPEAGDTWLIRFADDGTTPMPRFATWVPAIPGGARPPVPAHWEVFARPASRLVADATQRNALRDPEEIIPGDLVIEQSGGQYLYLGGGQWFCTFSPMAADDHEQVLVFDPARDPLGLVWRDERDRLLVVDTLKGLWDPRTTPSTSLQRGKLAYVMATRQLFSYQHDPLDPPRNRDEGLKAWEAINKQLHVIATEADLPDPGIRPVDHGDLYLVTSDSNGQPVHRLYAWDDDALGPGVGYWRPINTRNWVKATQADPNQISAVQPGDLQATVENGHKELKVFDNQAGDWVDLFTEDDIRAWIAALSLFRGTVAEVGGSAPGVIEVSALPDLLAMTAAKDSSETAHYWIWQGQDGYVIPAVGDPDEIGGGLSADLHGSRLNVGDWLQISDRGTPGHPDLHWVRVGGDLMTRKRWGDLTVVTWTAGAHERGTIAVFDGKLYRATRDVTAQDPDPRPADLVVTLTSGTPDTAWLNGNPLDEFPPVPNNGDVVQATASGVLPVINPPGGTGTYAAGDTFIYSSNPAFQGQGTTKEGLPYGDGWIALGQTLPATVTATMPAPATPWQEIPLAGGVKTVQADANLPTSNVENGELYLVIDSAAAGHNPRLLMWDKPHARWVPLSGGAIKNHPTPAALPTTNVADGDVRLILDTGAPHHRAGLYYYDGTNQAWREICCGIPLALSAGEVVYPDVIQMGGTIVGTPWEGQMWHAPLSDAARKMDPVQIYRERQWEFVTGWGWQTLGAGTLFPGYFSANPSNAAKPVERVFLAFQYYGEWVAPFYKKTANGDWHRLRQNILDNYIDVQLHDAGTWTGDLYSGTIGNAQSIANLQAGDVIHAIATVHWRSTAAQNTWSSGWFAFNIGGVEKHKILVSSFAGSPAQTETLHGIFKVPSNGSVALSVTFGGFNHSIQYSASKLTASVIGAG